MFCGNCGGEIQNDYKICPTCGAPIKWDATQQGKTNFSNPQYNTGFGVNSTNKKKSNWRKFKIIGILFLLFCIIFSVIDAITQDSKDYSKVESKLESFTKYKATGEDYSYAYNNWVIRYGDNEWAKITDSSLNSIVRKFMGNRNTGFEGYIAYDFSSDEVRLYFDCEMQDGHLSIINYSLNQDKFTVMVDGERYDMDDDFEKDIRQAGLIPAIKEDINSFKKDLQNNGVSYSEIKDMTYKDIKRIK